MPQRKSSILKQVNACKKRIAHERDVLNDLITDLKAIEDSTERAVNALEDASDALNAGPLCAAIITHEVEWQRQVDEAMEDAEDGES